MSQPPKSTILAPSARWVSLSSVFCVIATPWGRAASGGPNRPAIIASREGRTPHGGTPPAPPHGSADGGHLQHHPVGGEHAHVRAGGQVGAFDLPEGIGDLH